MGAAGNLGDSGCTHYSKRKAWAALVMHKRTSSGLHWMVVRLPAGVLACRLHVLGRLMVDLVVRLRLRGVRVGLGSGGLLEVVRVNFLLSVGLHQERGPSTDCDY